MLSMIALSSLERLSLSITRPTIYFLMRHQAVSHPFLALAVFCTDPRYRDAPPTIQPVIAPVDFFAESRTNTSTTRLTALAFMIIILASGQDGHKRAT